MFSALRIGGWHRYSQCVRGIKVEDPAFELMTPAEAIEWKQRLLVIHDPVAAL